MKHARPEWGPMRPERMLARLGVVTAIREATLATGHRLYERYAVRTIEVVVVRVATLKQSRYEWVAHTLMAVRNGVLTEQEIARIAAGAQWLTGLDAAIVQGVDDLVLNPAGTLGGATRAALGDQAEAVEEITGFYAVLALLVAGLEPEEDPLPGLETPALATALLEGTPHA